LGRCVTTRNLRCEVTFKREELTQQCRLAAAGPGGVSPTPSSRYTDSEADLKADKGPDPPDGKTRVRMRLTKVEFEKSGKLHAIDGLLEEELRRSG
jgi:hypothetical protein